MPTLPELIRLLTEPNESLAVEYKNWLRLDENPDRATLAKATIALANHGGGIIVLGMRPNNADGGALSSQPRPENLRRYSQDDVNAAINRYADPQFHCDLIFAHHPDTDIEHAFVSVPAGLTVPVMTTRECVNVIRLHCCYIRKPGPRSEEPRTAEEWRSLFGRCLQNGRESMLDAIRLIVHGGAGAPLHAEVRDALLEFRAHAERRWKHLIRHLPDDDPARLRFGRYEFTFELRNVPPAPTLTELQRRITAARAVRYTGWGPFLSLEREPHRPYVVDGVIEAWLGTPQDGVGRPRPDLCDFWRAEPRGRFFSLRAYDEDSATADGIDAGTIFDLTLPIWRLGEALLFVGRIGRLYGENPRIVTHCRYLGLNDRVLSRMDGRGRVWPPARCRDSEVTLEADLSVVEVEDNLPEVVHSMLVPLYERFDFFALDRVLVVEELERMKGQRV